jgi:hypothetical protein
MGPGLRRDDAEIFCFPARSTAAFCNGEFAISQLLFDALAFAGQFFRKQHAYNGLAAGKGTKCSILQRNKIRKIDPANGQWQLRRLLCMEAAGIQAPGPDFSRPAITREETCVN